MKNHSNTAWRVLLCRKLDRLGTDTISQEEFRAAIESRFNLELTDGQFEGFLDRIPLDEEGNVLYARFMQQFDTKYVFLCRWLTYVIYCLALGEGT